MKARTPLRSGARGVQTSRPYSAPAPVLGWNQRDSLSAMGERFAVVLDNFFPAATKVSLRKGAEDWVTGFLSAPKAFLTWNGPTDQKLFAATNSSVYDVTAEDTSPGSVELPVTSSDISYTNITVAGGTYLVMANGADSVFYYDGSNWIQITGVSTPALTGIATSSLSYVTVAKQRLWFVEKGSANAWYLGAGAVGGALTKFPLGQQFTRGGYLVAIGSWTIDGGDGSDDYVVFVSSEGQIAVYKGTDPSSASTFSKIGTYYVGEPVGKNCLTDYGGDLLYLSTNGLLPLSKLLQSSTVNYASALTDVINPAFAAATAQYGTSAGWSVTVFPAGNLLLVNIPLAANYAHQYVMNTVTGAWCRFTGLNANAWCVFQRELYIATATAVGKAWTGTSDFGAAITGTCQTAFSYLGARGRMKHYKLLRPVVEVDQSVQLRLGLRADYHTQDTVSLTSVGLDSTSFWSSATWDTSVWAGATSTVTDWASLDASPGHALSLLLEISSVNATFSWIATDFLGEIGGVL